MPGKHSLSGRVWTRLCPSPGLSFPICTSRDAVARPGARAVRRPVPFALAPSLWEPTPSTLSCKRAGRPRLLPAADTRQGRADDTVVTPCAGTAGGRPKGRCSSTRKRARRLRPERRRTPRARCRRGEGRGLRGALLDTRDTVNSRAGSPGLRWKGSSSPLPLCTCYFVFKEVLSAFRYKHHKCTSTQKRVPKCSWRRRS